MKKIIAFVLLICAYVAYSVNAENNFYVVDGDSLERGQERIRLQGIDAPELFQECYDATKQKYRCGEVSKKFLQSLMVGKIECVFLGKDKYNRSLKECFAEDGSSINENMVLSGWAVAYGDEYSRAEQKARKSKRGIWQGKFMRPELFRAINREKHSENKKR